MSKSTNLFKFLQKDKFWNAQIEQIYVKYNGDVNLVPRVGGQIIEMGKLTNYEEKLENWKKSIRRLSPKKVGATIRPLT